MTDLSKIRPAHTQRTAYVYIRQSTPGQVEHNRESTARQYALADRACELGWSKTTMQPSPARIWIRWFSIRKRTVKPKAASSQDAATPGSG